MKLQNYIPKAKSVFCLLLLALMLPNSFVFAQDRSRGGGNVKTNGENRTALDKRIALVIGNAAYTNAKPLDNPANDANDMAAALKTLGFEVISGTNQNKKQIETLIRQFGARLAETNFRSMAQTLLKYDLVGSFSDGLAVAALNGKYGFIDKTGREVIPVKYDSVWCRAFRKEGFIGVELNGKKGFVDVEGNEYFDF